MIIPYSKSFIQTISVQDVLWTYIKGGAEFEIELISPMKATVNEFGDGSYITFVVQIIDKNNVPILDNSDILLFQFPLRTWERAMYSIPLNKKREWNNLGRNNILVRIRKDNKSHLTILKVETRKVTTEQDRKARKYYLTELEMSKKNAEDIKRREYYKRRERRQEDNANTGTITEPEV